MDYMTRATDKLSFHTQHAYMMHEYMTELIYKCMTDDAMIKNSKFITVTEYGTKQI